MYSEIDLPSSTCERALFHYCYLNSFFFFLFVSLASLLSSNLNSIITLHYTCITLLFAQYEAILVAFVLVCPLSFAHSARVSRQLSELTSSSAWSFFLEYFYHFQWFSWSLFLFLSRTMQVPIHSTYISLHILTTSRARTRI